MLRIAPIALVLFAGVAAAQQPAPAPAPSPAPSPYPPVRAVDVHETIHGVDVVDSYRWLEDLDSPDTQAFFRAEADYARAQLDRIPGRDRLLERIRSLSEFQVTVLTVAVSGSRVFYLKLVPGLAGPTLFMRDGFAGAEKKLVDPDRFSEGPRKGAIDWFVPSPDGRHVAYGTSTSGTEASVLRVLDVASGKDLPVAIDRARFNNRLSWTPDSRSFFYARLADGQEAKKRYANIRVYRHLLGREASRDEIVFAPGVGGARDVPEVSFPYITVPVDSHFAYAVVREGARRELAVHATELKELEAGTPRWRKLVAFEDDVIAVEPWKDELLLLSHQGADRHKVLRIPASGGSVAKAKVAVPEGDAVIQGMAMAQDALYIRSNVGGVDRLEKLPVGFLGLKKPEFVKTPFDTHIAQIIASPRQPGALLKLQGWIEPPAIVHVDAKTADLLDTKLQPKPTADFDAMDEVRLYATAADGTKIPVTLVYLKTTTLNGLNPLILSAYGSYGTQVIPMYDPARLAWLERGGILAVAHVRGGGEYGEGWHRAGRLAAKRNTVQDLVTVAEFISNYGFTSAKRLAIEGSGAGGIPVGGALVRRPELFAAVVPRVPMMDMLRFDVSPAGRTDIPEFGSIASKAGFDALREISPYHQVKDGTAYPAVLFSAGMNDARIDPWHAGKMAARLQAANPNGKPVLLRVDYEAGHGPGTNRRRREEEVADVYAFLLWQFGIPEFQPPVAIPLAPAAPIVPMAAPAPAPETVAPPK